MTVVTINMFQLTCDGALRRCTNTPLLEMQTTARLVAWKEGFLLQVTGSAVEETLDEHAPRWEGFAYRKRKQQCLLLPHNSNKGR